MMAEEEDRYETLSTCMVQAELALDDSERENIRCFASPALGRAHASGAGAAALTSAETPAS